MRRNLFFSISILFLTATIFLSGCKSPDIVQFGDRNFTYTPKPDAIPFEGLWGYVMNGCEKDFSTQIPLSDVLYFIAPITTLSEVRQPAEKDRFFGNFNGRVHIVSACNSSAQTHLILDPSLPLREKIINGLIKAAETYDGLQIDWENIPAEDTLIFHDFLRELKKRLGTKMLTVAVKARIRTLKDDAFDYRTIGEIADKIFIMAYDEHWSTSKPGPIASNGWVKKIAEYAATQIPPEKTVMGISFYGRTWTEDAIGSKAWYSGTMQKMLVQNRISDIKRDEDGIPFFTQRHKVTVTGYYDDLTSLRKRCGMCAELGIREIGFWRIGFEDVNFWQNVVLVKSRAE